MTTNTQGVTVPRTHKDMVLQRARAVQMLHGHEPSGAAAATVRRNAQCKPANTEAHFPDLAETKPAASQQRVIASQLCSGCPEVTRCLWWALSEGFDDGIWGRMIATDRRMARRELQLVTADDTSVWRLLKKEKPTHCGACRAAKKRGEATTVQDAEAIHDPSGGKQKKLCAEHAISAGCPPELFTPVAPDEPATAVTLGVTS